MKNHFLKLALSIAILSLASCNLLKSINYVTVCAEPGTIVELSRYGKYKVNNKPSTRKTADSLCTMIALKQLKNYN